MLAFVFSAEFGPSDKTGGHGHKVSGIISLH